MTRPEGVGYTYAEDEEDGRGTATGKPKHSMVQENPVRIVGWTYATSPHHKGGWLINVM